jgi:hypothetical protein
MKFRLLIWAIALAAPGAFSQLINVTYVTPQEQLNSYASGTGPYQQDSIVSAVCQHNVPGPNSCGVANDPVAAKTRSGSENSTNYAPQQCNEPYVLTSGTGFKLISADSSAIYSLSIAQTVPVDGQPLVKAKVEDIVLCDFRVGYVSRRAAVGTPASTAINASQSDVSVDCRATVYIPLLWGQNGLLYARKVF